MVPATPAPRGRKIAALRPAEQGSARFSWRPHSALTILPGGQVADRPGRQRVSRGPCTSGTSDAGGRRWATIHRNESPSKKQRRRFSTIYAGASRTTRFLSTSSAVSGLTSGRRSSRSIRCTGSATAPWARARFATWSTTCSATIRASPSLWSPARTRVLRHRGHATDPPTTRRPTGRRVATPRTASWRAAAWVSSFAFATESSTARSR